MYDKFSSNRILLSIEIGEKMPNVNKTSVSGHELRRIRTEIVEIKELLFTISVMMAKDKPDIIRMVAEHRAMTKERDD